MGNASSAATIRRRRPSASRLRAIGSTRLRRSSSARHRAPARSRSRRGVFGFHHLGPHGHPVGRTPTCVGRPCGPRAGAREWPSRSSRRPECFLPERFRRRAETRSASTRLRDALHATNRCGPQPALSRPHAHRHETQTSTRPEPAAFAPPGWPQGYATCEPPLVVKISDAPADPATKVRESESERSRPRPAHPLRDGEHAEGLRPRYPGQNHVAA